MITKLGSQWKQRSDTAQRAEVGAQDKWSRVRADEKNKWSASVEVLRERRWGEDWGTLRCKRLHPAMIRVHAGWFMFSLKYWASYKKNYIPLNYWWLYFERMMWYGGVAVWRGWREDWSSDVAIVQLGDASTYLHFSLLSSLINAPFFSFLKYQNFNNDNDIKNTIECEHVRQTKIRLLEPNTGKRLLKRAFKFRGSGKMMILIIISLRCIYVRPEKRCHISVWFHCFLFFMIYIFSMSGETFWLNCVCVCISEYVSECVGVFVVCADSKMTNCWKEEWED